jgi:hypothetical protein
VARLLVEVVDMNTKQLTEYLALAGVPDGLHAQVIDCMAEARKRSAGLTWAKWRTRLFRAGKIAKAMPWEANRLIDVRPDWADSDIAPMLNITGHGDNGDWVDTPEGGRPDPDRWLNQDPASEDYQQAVAHCYWSRGHHPRSTKARKAWYRRNGGEYRAWRLGMPVGEDSRRWTYHSDKLTVEVANSGDAWIINARRKLLGKLWWDTRCGFEVDNVFQRSVFDGVTIVQAWYPIPGHELRAPVTWSKVPAWGRK